MGFTKDKKYAKSKYDESSLNKLTIAIQGANNVGSSLIDLLYKEESGIKILLSDHNYDSMKIIQDKYPEVKIVDLEELISSKCDILSPCANGGIINNENYKKLKCKIIAPGAVNILTDDSIADKLYKKDILFAPDFLINAGEVIQIQNEISGLPYETAIESVNELTDTLSNVLRISAEEKIPAYHIAKRIAEERIRNISFIKNIF